MELDKRLYGRYVAKINIGGKTALVRSDTLTEIDSTTELPGNAITNFLWFDKNGHFLPGFHSKFLDDTDTYIKQMPDLSIRLSPIGDDVCYLTKYGWVTSLPFHCKALRQHNDIYLLMESRTQCVIEYTSTGELKDVTYGATFPLCQIHDFIPLHYLNDQEVVEIEVDENFNLNFYDYKT